MLESAQKGVVIYGLTVPRGLNMQEFLEMALPAFKWLTIWGFFLGLIESFLYGVYAGLVFVPSTTFSLADGAFERMPDALLSHHFGERN